YFWLPTSDSIRQWLFDVTWATNLYVAVGDHATVMTSGNGIDWALELVPDSVTNSIFLGVGGTTNLLLAAGNQGSLIYSPYAETNITVTNIVGTNVVVTNQTVSTLGVVWYAVQPRPTTFRSEEHTSELQSRSDIVSRLNLPATPFPYTTLFRSIFLGVGGTTNLLLAAGNQGSLIYSPYAETNITVTNIVGTNVVVTNQTVSTLGVVWYAVQPRPTTF